MKNQLTNYGGFDGYQQRYTYNAQGHMIKRESKGSASRQTLEAIATSAGESAAATDDGGSDDDPDPYANANTSDTWSTTTYVYDVTAPYYEVLSETTDGVTTAYEYGVERIFAYEKIGWNTLKTDYVYDGRGSVAQELTYNSSWYTFGGFLSNKGVNSYTYTPFGELLTGEGAGFRFNGEYYDSATGMLNLRARQYEPGVMRFSQRDIWHGMIEMPTSQNRYLYCVNEPIGYYDRGGHRFDEGSGVPQKITTSTPVKDVEEDLPSFGDSAQELRREQLALQKIKTANRQLENTLASAGIDINNTDDYTRQIVEEAQREIAVKAASGTLTASEQSRIVQSVCSSIGHSSDATIADLLREFIESGFNEFKDYLDFREEVEPIEHGEFSNLSLGSFELSRIYTTLTAGSYQNSRKTDSPDINLVFLSSTKGMGIGSSFYYKDYFSSLVVAKQSLSIEVGYNNNSYGLTFSAAGDKVVVSFDSTIYNDDTYVRTSTVVSTHKLLVMAGIAGAIGVGCAPELALPLIELSALGKLLEAASKLIPSINPAPVY